MSIPVHVAIIPDGNRRWAKQKGLPAFEGHRTGAEKALPDLVERAHEIGIKYLTFWALSTENIVGRSQQEIDGLFRLIQYFVESRLDELHKKGVRFKFIGNISQLPTHVQKNIEKARKRTEHNTNLTLIIALNYGGQDEIIRAIKKIDPQFISSLTRESFSEYVDTKDIPNPDMIIRTGGEQRLSGFMLWQSEYSELYFSSLFFPDFSPHELEKAITNFKERQRRYGT